MGLDTIKRLEELGVARVTTFAVGAADPIAAIRKVGTDVIAKLAR